MGRPRKCWPKRYCQNPKCGKELIRPRDKRTGKLISSTNFLRRKYCCLACAVRVREKPDCNIRNHRHKARKFLKDHCEMCGREPKYRSELDVHHIDGDITNNDPSNLQTLCRTPCHRIADNIRRNGGLVDHIYCVEDEDAF